MPVTLGPRQTALLMVLMKAGTGFVSQAEAMRVVGVEPFEAMIFRLVARIRAAGARLEIVHFPSQGWQLTGLTSRHRG